MRNAWAFKMFCIWIYKAVIVKWMENEMPMMHMRMEIWDVVQFVQSKVNQTICYEDTKYKVFEKLFFWAIFNLLKFWIFKKKIFLTSKSLDNSRTKKILSKRLKTLKPFASGLPNGNCENHWKVIKNFFGPKYY
jgi:hypothetical protein